MKTEIEGLVRENLTYAYGCAKEFFRQAMALGIDKEEVRAEARLALVEAATRYVENPGDQFRAYLAKTVDGRVKRFFAENSSLIGLKRSGPLRGSLWYAAKEMGKEVKSLTPEDIAVVANLIGTTVETLYAVWARTTTRDVSFDEVPEEGHALSETFILPAEEIDGRAYRMTPEEILLREEEKKIKTRRKSPEMEHLLLHSWLEFLPKEYAQVLRHRWLYPTRQNLSEPYPYRSFCNERYGGTQKDGGLSMSPERAKEIEGEAIEMLRRFARGDFVGADFSQVLKRVPKPLVKRFIEELKDGATVMAIEYRIIESWSLKIVARVWRKRLSSQLGRELSKEEAEKEVSARFVQACANLATKLGVAPANPGSSEA